MNPPHPAEETRRTPSKDASQLAFGVMTGLILASVVYLGEKRRLCAGSEAHGPNCLHLERLTSLSS